MKQTVLICLVSLMLSSCHYTTGSGNIITEKRNTGSFTGISASGGFDVEIRIGAVTSVSIEADDNIMKYVETKISEGVLEIGLKGLHSTSNIHLKAFITVPELNIVDASGGAEITAKDILKSNSKISFDGSGGGQIHAAVDAPEIDAEAGGGASITLNGRTKNYTASVSSGSNLDSKDLLSEHTKAEASSGASLSVHASKKLVADASSGAHIDYYGGAAVEKSTSSGGSVDKKD